MTLADWVLIGVLLGLSVAVIGSSRPKHFATRHPWFHEDE